MSSVKNTENLKSSISKKNIMAPGNKETNPNSIGKSSKSKTQSFLDPNSMAAQ